jgi:hypothetical protein
MALVYYSRTRFTVNLLPLLQQATPLRRVVTVFAGGKEGPINTSDFQAWQIPMLSVRGHVSSLVTLSLKAIAKKVPDVSFIHDFPGVIKTGLVRGAKGVRIFVLRAIFQIIEPLIYIPNNECGERQVFPATSARYLASTSGMQLLGCLWRMELRLQEEQGGKWKWCVLCRLGRRELGA